MLKQFSRITISFLAACLSLLILAGMYLLMAQAFPFDEAPEEALKGYLTAVYARDYEAAYPWISAEDRKAKSRKDYLRENPPFSGVTLELTGKLAKLIEFRDFRTEIQRDRATVRFTVKMPNANAPLLRDLFLDFDPHRLDRLPENEIKAIKGKLDEMTRQGALPMIEGEEQWELVKEPGGWRVFLNWAGAIRVLFEARVKDGLPWNFWPVQDVVLAQPGETLQAVYRAKNLSGRPLTAKAIHIDQPKDLAEKYLQIIQCFCFIQETLAPGEEKELPLTFRVHWDVPNDVKEFRVTYEFYPIEKFPQ